MASAGRSYDEVERRADAAWFTLEVNLRPRNDGSLAFHDRLGFVEVGQQETDYGTLVSLMAKPLSPDPPRPPNCLLQIARGLI